MLQRRALLSMALAALVATGCVSKPLTENVDPKGRSLVLLLDASASMAENDPGRARVEGASLAVALTGQHDNVGAIAFNARAKVLVPLHPSGPAAARELVRAELDEVGTSGSTDFGAALDAAEAMLEEGHAPRGSCAILLTDGLPTGHTIRLREFARAATANLTIPDAVPRFAAHGWRIFAIVFGPEAAETRGYLAELVGPTGGSVIEAKDASGLVEAFEAVSVQALGYLSANRLASDAVQVAPGTRRVAFLGRFEGKGDLGAVTCDGKPADEAQLIRFPRQAPFAVALVEDPPTGRWQVDAGGALAGLTLVEPGWTIELDPKAPPSVVEGGSRVPVSVRVKGDESALARVKDSMRLELEVKRVEKVLARVPLARAAASSSAELHFEGAFLAPVEEEPITVTAVATVTEGGKSFETRRSLAVSVTKGGKPVVETAQLSVSAATFTGFAGEELRSSVTLEGDPSTALVVTVEAPRGFTASPARVELAPKGRATIDLRSAANTPSGTLGLAVAPATAGIAPFRREASLTVERGYAPATVDVGTIKAGEKGRVTVEVRNVQLSAKAPLSVEKNVLLLDTAGLATGRFEGSLDARAGGTTRTIKVVANVESAAPKKLALQASWGWTKTTLDLGGEATFVLEPLVLAGVKAQIDPDLDIRIEPLGSGRYELRVFAPASLPAGRYTGVVKATVAGVDRYIPLALEVKR